MWQQISWKEEDKKSKLILVAKNHFWVIFVYNSHSCNGFAWGLILEKIICTTKSW